MKKILTYFLLTVQLFAACTKEKVVTETDEQTTLLEDNAILSPHSLSKALGKAIGYPAEKVLFDSKHNRFVIDDDIVIGYSDAQVYINRSIRHTNSNEHYRFERLVSNDYIGKIKVFIESSVTPEWKTAVQAALLNWNDAPNAKVQFTEVTAGSVPDIRVIRVLSNDQWVGRAKYPLGSYKSGDTIWINSKYDSYTASRKLFAMTHEAGHTIGLAHTDIAGNYFIPGTPTSDPNSIMNSFVLDWNGFTGGDKLALQTLYPAFDRTGFVNSSGVAFINEGAYLSSWKQQRVGVTDIKLTADRIAVRDNSTGALMVKEGASSASWTQQRPSVSSFAISSRWIAAVDPSGNAVVKSPNLNSTWAPLTPSAKLVYIDNGAVAMIDQSDNAYVRTNMSSSWVFVKGNIKQIAICNERIALLDKAGILQVKENWLSGATGWTTQRTSVTSFALSGSRILALSSGSLYAKNGALSSTWYLQANSVQSFAVAGPRIMIATTSGSVLIKEGPVNTGTYTQINSGGTIVALTH